MERRKLILRCFVRDGKVQNFSTVSDSRSVRILEQKSKRLSAEIIFVNLIKIAPTVKYSSVLR